MYRPIHRSMFFFLAFLTSSAAGAGAASALASPGNAGVAVARGLTATVVAMRPVVVGAGSSTAAPSVALGGLFLNVEIAPTLVSSTTSSATLKVSAMCEGTQIEPLNVPAIQVSVPLPGARTTGSPLTVAIEMPWDGGRRELSDGDYYTARSYDCTATLKLTTTSSIRTKTTTATVGAIPWDVQVTEQAATIPTTQPTNGDEVNSTTFETSSLDGTVAPVPVAIGISPETVVTVDQQELPPGSGVNISLEEPAGADIPSGAVTPLFAATVVRVGPEGATFDPGVILGLTPSGPLAEAEKLIPLTYREATSETEGDWIDCRLDGSCTPVDCPIGSGFDEGMVCLEVHHFSLWTLSSDQQIGLQVELMNGTAISPSWKCAPGAVCPTNLQFGAKVFSREAQPSGTWDGRMQVCVDGDGDATCAGAKDTLLTGLEIANPVCYSGTNCKAGGVSTGETSSGNYQQSLSNLAYPGWNSLKSSLGARDVYLAVGYDETKLPTRVFASSQQTQCPGNPSVTNSETLFDCLNLGVDPRLEQATYDPAIDLLVASTGVTFSSTQNLKAGSLSLYWANSDQCGDDWNPAGASKPTVTGLTSTSATASATALGAANVRAQLTSSAYGTVLGPCEAVTILDADGDGITVAKGDCDDTSPDIHPNALETCDWKDNNCDGVADEGVWFKKMAAAMTHAVGLCSDGTAWAWGQGSSYQVQPGHRKPAGRPSKLETLAGEKFVDISASNYATYLVNEDLSLWSVGSDRSGQLGLGNIAVNEVVSTLTKVNISNVIGVDGYASWSGPYGALAVTGDWRVYAWGDNLYGILGTPDLTSSSTPVEIAYFRENQIQIVQVSYGSTHALALDDGGRVWAWGGNAYGQLGQTISTTLQLTPVMVANLPPVQVIDAAANISSALTVEGDLYFWGYDDLSNAGNSPEIPSKSELTSVLGPKVHRYSLNAGSNGNPGTVSAILTDGSLWVWGGTSYYYLGYHSDIPIEVSHEMCPGLNSLEAFVALSNDWAALSCNPGATEPGELWQWGHNWMYPFIPTAGEILEYPTLMDGVTQVTDVEMGRKAFYMIGSYKGRSVTVLSMGYNSYGQLGDGSEVSSAHPVPIQMDSPVTPVQLARGNMRSFMIDDKGRLWGWGNNEGCELGTGDYSVHSSPVELELSKQLAAERLSVIDVSSAAAHTVAVDSLGRTWIWGTDTVGQMGEGGSHCAPALVDSSLEPMKKVYARSNYTLALSDTGYVYAWGENSCGQLGDGTTVNRDAPELLTALPAGAISSITAFGSISFAVSDAEHGGLVYTWGSASHGNMGRGEYKSDCPSMPAPVMVDASTPLTGVSRVVFSEAALALKDCDPVDGCELWGWGGGYPSILGQPNNEVQTYAIPIRDENGHPITGIVDVSQTSMMAVALKTDGTVLTWGWDFQAQVTEEVDYWWLKEPTRAFPE